MGTNGAKLTSWAPIIQALAAVKRRNVTPLGVIWSSRTAETFALLTDTLGQPLQPPQMVRDVPFYESNQVADNLTQGTAKEEASEVYVCRSDLLIGVRPTLGVRVRQLNERFADNLQVGLLAWLRADIQLAHPQSFNVITGVLAEPARLSGRGSSPRSPRISSSVHREVARVQARSRTSVRVSPRVSFKSPGVGRGRRLPGSAGLHGARKGPLRGEPHAVSRAAAAAVARGYGYARVAARSGAGYASLPERKR